MYLKKFFPVLDVLIINKNLWFWQKGGKKIGNFELLSTLLRVIGTTTTPTIQNRTFFFKVFQISTSALLH